MRYLRSALRLVLTALLLMGATFGAPKAAEASHFRYGHITWRSQGQRKVAFRVTCAFRRSRSPGEPPAYSGSAPDGLLAVGDTFIETIGATTLAFGDNTAVTGPGGGGLQFVVVALDKAKDYVIGRALDPVTGKDVITHTYQTAADPLGGPFVAEVTSGGGTFFPACCRVSTLNNAAPAYTGGVPGSEDFKVQTTVDLTQNTASAVSSLPPIIPVAQAGGSFVVPAVDANPDISLTFRLAKSASTTDILDEGEAGIVQPPGVTIDPQTGVYTVPADLNLGIWATQVIIEEHAGGPNGSLVGQTAVDFIFNVLPQVTTRPPTFLAPTPASGVTLTGVVGKTFNFTVQATDPDGDQVQLNTTGIPLGAVQNPVLPVVDLPVSSSMAWVPKPEDVGAYSVTYTAEDSHGNFVLTTVNFIIQPQIKVVVPNGGETLLQGQPVTIRWTSAAGARPQGVNIQLSTDGGATYPLLVAAGVPDRGVYNWTAPAVVSRHARIRITNVLNPDDYDDSDLDFTITDGSAQEICTVPSATPIPDYTPHPWTVVPLSYGLDKVVRGLSVRVDISHPFIGDLQVYLAPPDFTGDPNQPTVDVQLNQQAVLLHNQTGGRTANLVTQFGLNPGLTAPAEERQSWISKLYGRRSKGTWNLWVRDLKPGDVGQVNKWCLNVIGPDSGSFTVTSPNTSADRWAIGTTQTVTWTQSGIVGNAQIVLSRDGGANYNEVLGSAPASSGSFSWLVFGPPAAQARIRVQSEIDPVVRDESDADFSILNPFIQIQHPSNGESVAVGKPFSIQWTSVPMVAKENVKIELLHSDDSNFVEVLAAAAPNTGSFVYTFKAAQATQHARLRLTVTDLPARQTMTPVDFAIQASSLDTITPAATDVWYTYTHHNITWSSVGLSGNVRIDLSRDGGATWDVLFGSVPNSGSQDWLVSGDASKNAVVRVTSLENASIFGQTPAFEIRPMTVHVTAPNGGEAWGVGTTQAITWDADSVVGNVDILISRDAGQTFVPIVSDVANTGTYNWVASGFADSTAVIRVQAHNFPAFDVSDAPFSIVTPSLKVISPINGQELRAGTQADLQWVSVGLPGRVKLELSRNGGSTFTTLFADVPNGGVQTWTVTGPDTTNAVLKVTSLSMPSVSARSDAFKIVTPSIAVTSPNGGESWIQNTARTITWNARGFDGTVKIDLTRNGGQTWETLFPTAVNSGSAPWTVSGIPSTNARIRITSNSNSQVTDQSDAPFTIVPQFLRLGSPNGGSEYLAGSDQTVTWSSSGLDKTDKVRLELSTDGGNTWSTLADKVNNTGSAVVTLPGVATTQGVVRITLLSNPSIQDQSDRTFAISAPTLTVTAPGAGARWPLGSTQTIAWSGSAARLGGGSVRIELSRNGGASWETLYANTQNDGNAQWKVNGKATTKAQIRVTWSGAAGDVSGVSPLFSIVKAKKGK